MITFGRSVGVGVDAVVLYYGIGLTDTLHYLCCNVAVVGCEVQIRLGIWLLYALYRVLNYYKDILEHTNLSTWIRVYRASFSSIEIFIIEQPPTSLGMAHYSQVVRSVHTQSLL